MLRKVKDIHGYKLGARDGDIGRIKKGLEADLAVWDIDRPAELAYWLGKPMLHARYLGGERS